MNKRLSLIIIAVAITEAAVQAAEQPNKKPAVPPGIRVYRDVEYILGRHARNKLDLYLPTEADRPLPVIVWIHGGGWLAGSKEGCPAVQFVSKGYAVASINYRLSQHAVFPAQIEDCKAAIRWLRANAEEVQPRPQARRCLGCFGGRSPGRPAGHLRRREGT